MSLGKPCEVGRDRGALSLPTAATAAKFGVSGVHVINSVVKAKLEMNECSPEDGWSQPAY